MKWYNGFFICGIMASLYEVYTMYRVYLTIYIPNLVNGDACYYIGSTSKPESSGYLGSVISKKYRDFWQRETKEHPERFDHLTLEYCDSAKEALRVEHAIQKNTGAVKNKRFFNQSLAVKDGMFGRDVSGDLNPMHGRSRKGEKVGGAVTPMAGELNGMYGKDWREGKSKEELKDHAKKSARKGAANGCYGSRFLWITKGEGVNKRHDKTKPIPNGWVYGFSMKNDNSKTARMKKVRCVDTGEIFDSMTIAAEAKGVGAEKISLVCAGKRKRTGGLKWEYV